MDLEEKNIKEYVDLTKRDTYQIEFNPANVSILDDKIGGVPY